MLVVEVLLDRPLSLRPFSVRDRWDEAAYVSA